jgi:hemerythrin-like domain-containing protein
MPSTFVKAASEVMGAVKDIKATVRGMTGVFKHLMEEHGKVAVLMRRLRMASDEEIRAELYPTVRAELLAHETGEVKTVYRALAEYPAAAKIVVSHAEETSELRSAIAELDSLSFADVAWGLAFERLVELVERHVDQEESEFFPKAQEILGEEEAKALLPRFEAAKSAEL